MSSKKIKIAVASFNPITIVDGKKYGGFEIELWEKVAQEINMEYKYTKSKFSEIFRKLVNNKVDLAIAGISKTAEREEIIDFSHNTFNSGLAILVPPSFGLISDVYLSFEPSYWFYGISTTYGLPSFFIN